MRFTQDELKLQLRALRLFYLQMTAEVVEVSTVVSRDSCSAPLDDKTYKALKQTVGTTINVVEKLTPKLADKKLAAKYRQEVQKLKDTYQFEDDPFKAAAKVIQLTDPRSPIGGHQTNN